LPQWEYLGFLPHRLKSLLEEGGFEPEPILRTWKERGWLLLDAEGKPRHRARIECENPWLIAITRGGIEEVAGEQGNNEGTENI